MDKDNQIKDLKEKLKDLQRLVECLQAENQELVKRLMVKEEECEYWKGRVDELESETQSECEG